MKITTTYDSSIETAPAYVLIDTKVDPPDPPDPEPPPLGTIPTIVSYIVKRPTYDKNFGVWHDKSMLVDVILYDLTKHLVPRGFNDTGERYIRGQDTVEMAGQTIQIPQGVSPFAVVRVFIEKTENTTTPKLVWGENWTASFVLRPFDRSKPLLLGDPIILGSTAVASDTTFVDLTVDKSLIPEGWYMLSVSGLAGWGVLPYPVYVRHTLQAAPQFYMPVIVGSHTHNFNGNRVSYSFVPARFAPTVVPLPARTFPSGNPTRMSDLAYTMVVPFKEDDIYRPSQLPSGLWGTGNEQNYGFASRYQKPEPSWTILQGARGRGNMVMPLFVRGTARTDTAKILFCQAHNVGVIEGDGTIRIEAGYYHKEPPQYAKWDKFKQQRPPAKLELAGDWSGMDPAEWGFNEVWSVAVDGRTTAIDPNSPLIGVPPEHSHVVGPVKYVSDTQKDRICKLVFGKNDLSRIPKVTTWKKTPGSKYWGVECVGNLLIATLSSLNRVDAYDMDTNTLVWSAPVPNPEGIAVMDGIAYIGSFSTKAIYKLDLSTLVLAKFIDVEYDNNSQNVNVSVSDGTICPRGSVAYTTWGLKKNNGWFILVDPAGVRIPIGDRELGFGEPKGMHLPDGLSYPSCVYIGGGRIIWGTVQDGLHQLSMALPTDQVVPPEVARGVKYMKDHDLQIVHGDYFFGNYGVPVPWKTYGPDVDALLANMGHTK